MNPIHAGRRSHGATGRWRRRWNALAEDHRRWGLWRTLYMRLMERLRPALVLCHVFVRPLGRMVLPDDPPPGIAFRIATREELLAASAAPELELPARMVEAALTRGDLCAAAFDGERIVAYTWRAFHTAPHAHDLCLRFRTPYRYGYKAFTLPACRGMHLQTFLAPVTDAICIERGRDHGIGFIETHNFPSITMSRRNGHRHAGYIGYLRVFGRPLCFRSPAAVRLGFGFAPRAAGQP